MTSVNPVARKGEYITGRKRVTGKQKECPTQQLSTSINMLYYKCRGKGICIFQTNVLPK